MKIEYMREMKRSYMTVKMEDGEMAESYETGMLAKNQIPGLLKMKIKYTDGSPVYCYDITSRQPISRLFESQPADEKQVRSFFRQLYETLDRMEAYLLGDGGILLDPDLIYVDPEGFKTGFCVIPGRKEDFNSQLSLFIQYLMKHIDHKDWECVVLTYGLYQTCMRDNYSLEDMMEILAEKVPVKMPERVSEKMPERAAEEENVKREISWEWASETRREEWKSFKGSESSEGFEGSDPSEAEVSFSENSGWRLVKKLFLLLTFLAVTVGGTWFLYGVDVLAEFWIYGAIAGGILAVVIILSHFILEKIGKNKRLKDAETEVEDPWRVYYEDREEQEPAEDVYSHKEPEDRIRRETVLGTKEQQRSEMVKAEEEFQTILLTPKEGPDHVLEAAQPENRDIPVGYVPFVIGKHAGLSDYILDKPTVSRFHVRIMEKDGDYFLTDLNSTNGTKVNGRLLAANEETILKEGDEVQIAEEKYFWK